MHDENDFNDIEEDPEYEEGYDPDYDEEANEMMQVLSADPYGEIPLKCYTGEEIKVVGGNNHDGYMIAMMHEINKMATGVNFFLAMRDQYGSIGLYPRVNQPCFGEFRKYKNSNEHDKLAKPHGDLAHGSKTKPTDLFSPFPSGEPVAFGTAFRNNQTPFSDESDKLYKFVFSNDSPWKDAFGDEGAVEFTKNKDGRIIGVVIKTTDIDPSVFIQLCWMLSYTLTPVRINEWVRKGFTYKEACLIVILRHGSSSHIPQGSFDIKGFMTSSPYHILPMTFRKGADYARSSYPNETRGAEACWYKGGGYNVYQRGYNVDWRVVIDEFMKEEKKAA